MNWNAYVARRKINEHDWLNSRGIKDRSSFIAELIKIGVEVPAEEETASLFPAHDSREKKDVNESNIEPAQGSDQVAARSVASEGDRAGIRPNGRSSSKLRH